MLRVRDLTRSFREGSRIHHVLSGAQADIRTGESVAIVGRSGAGKSTLLHLIAGLESPDYGSILIDDFDMSASGEPARTLYRRASIGFVYQFFNLIPTLDVVDNVRLVLELNGMRGAEARALSADMLARVGLGDRLRSAVDTLSGGEQQRVAIARALVHRPKLVLADEPTGNLDAESGGEVQALLMGLTLERGATVILATHDAALTQNVSRVLELREGRLHECK
jgi:putative ABC transport system ATP-binding protein